MALLLIVLRAAGGGGRQGASAADGGDPHAAGTAAAAAADGRRAGRHAEDRDRAKIDEQTGANRKAFADQKLLVDNIAEGVRVLREKADDTNVRLSSMTQELEALRQTIASMPAPAPAPPHRIRCRRRAPTAAGAAAPGAGQPAAPAAHRRAAHLAAADVRQRVRRLHAGQYDLAILGFDTYINMFPQSRQGRRRAAEHRATRCTRAGKYREAVAAFQKVITNYPQSDSVPAGVLQARAHLRAAEADRPGAEGVRDRDAEVPDRLDAILAKQRLDSLNGKLTTGRSRLVRLRLSDVSRFVSRSRTRTSSTEPRTDETLERNVVVGQLADRLAHRLVRCPGAAAPRVCCRPPPPPPPPPSSTIRSPRISVVYALVAVLVVPLARLQPPFDVDLLPLRRGTRSGSRPSCPRARRGATRSSPAAGRPCRSRPPSSRG